MEWINATGINDFTGYFGFIYRINYEDGTFYIGKKNFVEEIKKPLGKKELAQITDGRMKKYKEVKKESNWRTYEGSSKETVGKCISSKTMLSVYRTQRALTFAEARMLFKSEALFDCRCVNGNILGKFFRNVFDGENR